jgi:hypothetical protein
MILVKSKVFESLVVSDDEMEKTEKTFIVKDEDSASLVRKKYNRVSLLLLFRVFPLNRSNNINKWIID